VLRLLPINILEKIIRVVLWCSFQLQENNEKKKSRDLKYLLYLIPIVFYEPYRFITRSKKDEDNYDLLQKESDYFPY